MCPTHVGLVALVVMLLLAACANATGTNQVNTGTPLYFGGGQVCPELIYGSEITLDGCQVAGDALDLTVYLGRPDGTALVDYNGDQPLTTLVLTVRNIVLSHGLVQRNGEFSYGAEATVLFDNCRFVGRSLTTEGLPQPRPMLMFRNVFQGSDVTSGKVTVQNTRFGNADDTIATLGTEVWRRSSTVNLPLLRQSALINSSVVIDTAGDRAPELSPPTMAPGPPTAVRPRAVLPFVAFANVTSISKRAFVHITDPTLVNVTVADSTIVVIGGLLPPTWQDTAFDDGAGGEVGTVVSFGRRPDNGQVFIQPDTELRVVVRDTVAFVLATGTESRAHVLTSWGPYHWDGGTRWAIETLRSQFLLFGRMQVTAFGPFPVVGSMRFTMRDATIAFGFDYSEFDAMVQEPDGNATVLQMGQINTTSVRTGDATVQISGATVRTHKFTDTFGVVGLKNGGAPALDGSNPAFRGIVTLSDCEVDAFVGTGPNFDSDHVATLIESDMACYEGDQCTIEVLAGGNYSVVSQSGIARLVGLHKDPSNFRVTLDRMTASVRSTNALVDKMTPAVWCESPDGAMKALSVTVASANITVTGHRKGGALVWLDGNTDGAKVTVTGSVIEVTATKYTAAGLMVGGTNPGLRASFENNEELFIASVDNANVIHAAGSLHDNHLNVTGNARVRVLAGEEVVVVRMFNPFDVASSIVAVVDNNVNVELAVVKVSWGTMRLVTVVPIGLGALNATDCFLSVSRNTLLNVSWDAVSEDTDGVGASHGITTTMSSAAVTVSGPINSSNVHVEGNTQILVQVPFALSQLSQGVLVAIRNNVFAGAEQDVARSSVTVLENAEVKFTVLPSAAYTSAADTIVVLVGISLRMWRSTLTFQRHTDQLLVTYTSISRQLSGVRFVHVGHAMVASTVTIADNVFTSAANSQVVVATSFGDTNVYHKYEENSKVEVSGNTMKFSKSEAFLQGLFVDLRAGLYSTSGFTVRRNSIVENVGDAAFLDGNVFVRNRVGLLSTANAAIWIKENSLLTVEGNVVQAAIMCPSRGVEITGMGITSGGSVLFNQDTFFYEIRQHGFCSESNPWQETGGDAPAAIMAPVYVTLADASTFNVDNLNSTFRVAPPEGTSDSAIPQIHHVVLGESLVPATRVYKPRLTTDAGGIAKSGFCISASGVIRTQFAIKQSACNLFNFTDLTFGIYVRDLDGESGEVSIDRGEHTLLSAYGGGMYGVFVDGRVTDGARLAIGRVFLRVSVNATLIPLVSNVDTSANSAAGMAYIRGDVANASVEVSGTELNAVSDAYGFIATVNGSVTSGALFSITGGLIDLTCTGTTACIGISVVGNTTRHVAPTSLHNATFRLMGQTSVAVTSRRSTALLMVMLADAVLSAIELEGADGSVSVASRYSSHVVSCRVIRESTVSVTGFRDISVRGERGTLTTGVLAMELDSSSVLIDRNSRIVVQSLEFEAAADGDRSFGAGLISVLDARGNSSLRVVGFETINVEALALHGGIVGVMSLVAETNLTIDVAAVGATVTAALSATVVFVGDTDMNGTVAASIVATSTVATLTLNQALSKSDTAALAVRSPASIFSATRITSVIYCGQVNKGLAITATVRDFSTIIVMSDASPAAVVTLLAQEDSPTAAAHLDVTVRGHSSGEAITVTAQRHSAAIIRIGDLPTDCRFCSATVANISKLAVSTLTNGVLIYTGVSDANDDGVLDQSSLRIDNVPSATVNCGGSSSIGLSASAVGVDLPRMSRSAIEIDGLTLEATDARDLFAVAGPPQLSPAVDSDPGHIHVLNSQLYFSVREGQTAYHTAAVARVGTAEITVAYSKVVATDALSAAVIDARDANLGPHELHVRNTSLTHHFDWVTFREVQSAVILGGKKDERSASKLPCTGTVTVRNIRHTVEYGVAPAAPTTPAPGPTQGLAPGLPGGIAQASNLPRSIATPVTTAVVDLPMDTGCFVNVSRVNHTVVPNVTWPVAADLMYESWNASVSTSIVRVQRVDRGSNAMSIVNVKSVLAAIDGFVSKEHADTNITQDHLAAIVSLAGGTTSGFFADVQRARVSSRVSIVRRDLLKGLKRVTLPGDRRYPVSGVRSEASIIGFDPEFGEGDSVGGGVTATCTRTSGHPQHAKQAALIHDELRQWMRITFEESEECPITVTTSPSYSRTPATLSLSQSPGSVSRTLTRTATLVPTATVTYPTATITGATATSTLAQTKTASFTPSVTLLPTSTATLLATPSRTATSSASHPPTASRHLTLTETVPVVPEAEPITAPPEIKAIETASSAAAASTSALAMSPATAVQASRTGVLLKGQYCSGLVDEPLPFYESPTGWPLVVTASDRRLRYYVGAAVMNPILLVICTVIHVFVACIHFGVVGRHQRPAASSAGDESSTGPLLGGSTANTKTVARPVAEERYVGTLMGSLTWARFPSILVFPFLFLLQPTVTAVVTIFTYGASSRTYFAIIVSEVSVLAAVFGLAYAVTVGIATHCDFKAEEADAHEVLGKTKPPHLVIFDFIFGGRGRWADKTTNRTTGWTRRYFGTFGDYVGGRRWFLLCEAITCVFLGVCGGLLVLDTCFGVNITMMIYFLLFLIGVIALRPHQSRFDLTICLVLTGTQSIAAAINVFGGEAGRVRGAVEGILSFAMFANLLQGFIKVFEVVVKTARRGQREEAREVKKQKARSGQSQLDQNTLQEALLTVAQQEEATITREAEAEAQLAAEAEVAAERRRAEEAEAAAAAAKTAEDAAQRDRAAAAIDARIREREAEMGAFEEDDDGYLARRTRQRAQSMAHSNRIEGPDLGELADAYVGHTEVNVDDVLVEDSRAGDVRGSMLDDLLAPSSGSIGEILGTRSAAAAASVRRVEAFDLLGDDAYNGGRDGPSSMSPLGHEQHTAAAAHDDEDAFRAAAAADEAVSAPLRLMSIGGTAEEVPGSLLTAGDTFRGGARDVVNDDEPTPPADTRDDLEALLGGGVSGKRRSTPSATSTADDLDLL